MGTTNSSQNQRNISELSDTQKTLINKHNIFEEKQVHHKLYGDHINIYKFTNQSKKVGLIVRYFHDENTVKQKAQEAQTLSQLDHQHVVKLIDYGKEQGQEYCSTFFKISYLFEFCENNLIDDIMLRRNCGSEFYKEDELWYIAASVLSGLQYLENYGIYHQDIYPENILLDNEGNVKIMFNRIVSSKYNYLYQLLGIAGDKCYLSPEQLKQMKNLERNHAQLENNFDLPKSDIFSLGICLLQAALLRKELDQVYYLNIFQINEFNLNKNLGLVQDQYSPQFANFLSTLLIIDPENRPNIQQSIHLIENVISQGNVQISEKLYSMIEVLKDPKKVVNYEGNFQVYGTEYLSPGEIYQNYIQQEREKVVKQYQEKFELEDKLRNERFKQQTELKQFHCNEREVLQEKKKLEQEQFLKKQQKQQGLEKSLFQEEESKENIDTHMKNNPNLVYSPEIIKSNKQEYDQEIFQNQNNINQNIKNNSDKNQPLVQDPFSISTGNQQSSNSKQQQQSSGSKQNITSLQQTPSSILYRGNRMEQQDNSDSKQIQQQSIVTSGANQLLKSNKRVRENSELNKDKESNNFEQVDDIELRVATFYPYDQNSSLRKDQQQYLQQQDIEKFNPDLSNIQQKQYSQGDISSTFSKHQEMLNFQKKDQAQTDPQLLLQSQKSPETMLRINEENNKDKLNQQQLQQNSSKSQSIQQQQQNQFDSKNSSSLIDHVQKKNTTTNTINNTTSNQNNSQQQQQLQQPQSQIPTPKKNLMQENEFQPQQQKQQEDQQQQNIFVPFNQGVKNPTLSQLVDDYKIQKNPNVGYQQQQQYYNNNVFSTPIQQQQYNSNNNNMNFQNYQDSATFNNNNQYGSNTGGFNNNYQQNNNNNYMSSQQQSANPNQVSFGNYQNQQQFSGQQQQFRSHSHSYNDNGNNNMFYNSQQQQQQQYSNNNTNTQQRKQGIFS